MRAFRLKDKSEALAVTTAALKKLGRSDTPYAVGVVAHQAAGGQVVCFDLPRVSPLQFNVMTKEVSRRQQLIDKIKSAIGERMGIV